MASHLVNPKVITRDWSITFQPLPSGTPIIIDHGQFTLPGTEAGTEYSYTTDEETLKGISSAAGYTQLQIETVVDDNYQTFVDWGKEAKAGTMTIAPKAGTTATGTWSLSGQIGNSEGATFGINSPNIPVYTLNFSVNHMTYTPGN